jgi:hypothetical protein
MTDLLAASWAADQAYFASAWGLLWGGLDPWGALAGVGIVCLLAGTVLSLIWRESRSRWMILMAAIAALTPLWLGLAYAALGWLALTLLLVVGFIMLLVVVALIANDATRRLPAWLLGIFVLSLAGYTGLVAFTANVAL